MDNEQTTNTSLHAKLAIGLLVGLFVLGGFLAFLIKYYELFSNVSQQVSNSPIQQQVKETPQPVTDYKTESKGLLDAYLRQVENEASLETVNQATNNVRNSLLAMRVSAEDKASHLAKVLLLEEISRLAVEGNTEKLSQKINKLKELNLK